MAGGRRFWWALGGVALAGLVVRVLYVYIVARDRDPGLDTVWYLLVGGSLYEGGGYVDPSERLATGSSVPTANFPPLYPTVVALVRAVAGTSLTSLQLAGAALGTVTVVLTGLLGRRMVGPAVGLLAAALAAVLPSLVAADGSAMSENVYVPLVVGAALCLLVAVEHRGYRWWVAGGVLLGLATLARPDGLILGSVLIAGVVLARRRLPRDGREGRAGHGVGPVVAFVVMLAVLAPWSAYASLRMDALVVTSTATDKTLAGANCDRTWSLRNLGTWDAGCLDVAGAEDGVDGDEGAAAETERARRWREQAADYAADHPERVAVSAGARVARTFGLWAPGPLLDAEVVESRSRPWQTGAWIVWLPVLVSAVWGFVILRRRGCPTWPITSLVVGVSVSAVLAWGNQRFRLAAEPAILVASATAVLHVVESSGWWGGSRAGRSRSGPALDASDARSA